MKNYSTENVSLENLHGKVEFCLTNDYLFRAVLHLATNEDKRYNIDKWASLFKAYTWEKLKDVSKQNVFMEEAAKSMYIFAEDERVREELIRQKEFEADQRWLHTTLKEYEANQKRMNKTIAEQNTLLNDKDRQIVELEAIIAEMKQKS